MPNSDSEQVCCSLVQDRRRIFEELAKQNAESPVYQPKHTEWKYKSMRNINDTELNDENEYNEPADDCECVNEDIHNIPPLNIPPKPSRPPPLPIKPPPNDSNSPEIDDESEQILLDINHEYNESNTGNSKNYLESNTEIQESDDSHNEGADVNEIDTQLVIDNSVESEYHDNQDIEADIIKSEVTKIQYNEQKNERPESLKHDAYDDYGYGDDEFDTSDEEEQHEQNNMQFG